MMKSSNSGNIRKSVNAAGNLEGFETTYNKANYHAENATDGSSYEALYGSGTKRIYVYGQGLICEKKGVSTLYHLYNNLGSTMKLSDKDGNIGNSKSLNRYSYVEGNPVSYTDPFGLSPSQGWLSVIGHGILGIVGCIPGLVGCVANSLLCGWHCVKPYRHGAGRIGT